MHRWAGARARPILRPRPVAGLRRAATVAQLLALVTLAACAPSPARNDRAAALTVTGTVGYRERVALRETAVVLVQLVDVTRTDAPGVVLAEQFIHAHGRQVPFAFQLEPYPTSIVASHAYAVQARIEDGGRLLFVTDRRYPVLTRGATNRTDVVLRAVSPPKGD